MKKQKIGFDFDKVFVDYPPFVPDFMIDYLYKKKNSHLSYRMPGAFEKQIRVFSHHNFFRPAIKTNIDSLSKILKKGNIEAYIVSSRFSFLKSRTNAWIKTNKLSNLFKKMYFNFDDKQPHIFKEEVLRNENIDKFIDDDLDLLRYLSKRNPKIEFFWLSQYGNELSLPKNITHIKNLNEFVKYV
ncbi:MAG TPA: hypothetical protein VG965_07100 [Patescibacteria group bacterium]|nr:hypothetical protein [Patescibacteria group bacterium]